MIHKKRLPIGYSNVRDIITSDCIYVDKTQYLYELIASGVKYNLLTRPRRFGKSLVISTLEEIYGGNKELFKDQWIGKSSDYSWKKFSVIKLDLSSVDSSSAEALKRSLSEKLHDIAQENGVSIIGRSNVGSELEALVKALAKDSQAVLLIDEYDYPLTAQLKNTDRMEANAEVLRSFYTALKSLNAYIHCMFIVGVSKYPQESMFSGLNNVKDLSFLPQYAALTGYTQDELEMYFGDYIGDIAIDRGVDRQVVLAEMREWYNGYHFSSSPISVYNPYSILHYLSDKRCDNYWFESGTPTFLVTLLKKWKFTVEDFERVLQDSTRLKPVGFTSFSLDMLLYQTGYLTINESFTDGGSMLPLYTLKYPNKEVQMSMQYCIVSALINLPQDKVDALGLDLRRALLEQNIALFVGKLQLLLACIPYSLHIESEAYYHSLLQVVFELSGFTVHSEMLTSVGRIDVVIETDKAVFVIELKCKKSPAVAIAQIKERRYYERFIGSGKQIFLIGLALNFPNKKLSISYESEVL